MVTAHFMDFENPPHDPVKQCKEWLAEASELALHNPDAMTLATVDENGHPAARVVLLKGIDKRGAIFHTNRLSAKGLELAANPRASLLFYWDQLLRQIRIDGDVSLLSDEESDAYFATRLRGSQIGAWASRQSQPIENRAALDAAVREVKDRFKGAEIPRPPFWGGYRVSLQRIEFWQGLGFRLHDRVVYTSDDSNGWTVQRLCP